jgi:hypothetical protein
MILVVRDLVLYRVVVHHHHHPVGCSLALQLGARVSPAMGSHFQWLALKIMILQFVLLEKLLRMPSQPSALFHQYPLRDNQPLWERSASLKVGLPG